MTDWPGCRNGSTQIELLLQVIFDIKAVRSGSLGSAKIELLWQVIFDIKAVIFEIQQSIFEQVITDINEPITGSIEDLGESTCATE